jgi:hypothetical protein
MSRELLSDDNPLLAVLVTCQVPIVASFKNGNQKWSPTSHFLLNPWLYGGESARQYTHTQFSMMVDES